MSNPHLSEHARRRLAAKTKSAPRTKMPAKSTPEAESVIPESSLPVVTLPESTLPEAAPLAPPGPTLAHGSPIGTPEGTASPTETATPCPQPSGATPVPVTVPTTQTPIKAPNTSQRLSALDAAAQVLAGANEPMNCVQLIASMEHLELWVSPGGKTPAATLYAAISKEIQLKGDASRFAKAGRGMFQIRSRGG